MKLLILLLIFLVNDPNLWGTWKCVQTEISDTIGQCEQRFTLNEDGTGIEYTHNRTFSYTLKDSKLKLGKEVYKVKNLTSESLIIQEHNEDGIGSARTLHFVKEK